MKLLGIEFGRVWNSSGASNFFGEGWPFHRWLGPLAPDFGAATFVAKTTTVEPRAGNMPLRGTMPVEWKPRCIVVNFRKAAVLNAVGLSGPGLMALLADGRWQSRLSPFLLSFMAVDKDLSVRLAKAREFADAIAAERSRFRAPFGIEINCSCPNVGIDTAGMTADALRALALGTIAQRLPGVPLIPKINALVPVDVARRIAEHKDCAAVAVSNTIPWGALPDRIDWRGLFGEVSPLARFGGGGLSGDPIRHVVADWVASAVRGGFPCPVVAGGGIMRPSDALELLGIGASAVELGSVAIVRPWRVASIVRSVQDRATESVARPLAQVSDSLNILGGRQPGPPAAGAR